MAENDINHINQVEMDRSVNSEYYYFDTDKDSTRKGKGQFSEIA